jgi:ligand-binding sensor domain-containing protein
LRDLLYSFFLVTQLFFISKTEAQNYIVRTFEKEDGLRGQFVNSIKQDSLGYLFLATEQGVFKFDGNDFESVYESPVENSVYPTCLEQCKKGRELIGTNNGKIVCANFTGFDTIFKAEESTSFLNFCQGKNAMYALSSDYTLAILKDNDDIDSIGLDKREELFGIPTTFNVVGPYLFVGTNEGLLVWNFDEEQYTSKFWQAFVELEFISVTALKKVDENTLMVGTEDMGVFVLKMKGGNYTLIPLSVDPKLAMLSISDIEISDDKHVWLATKFDGVYKVDINENFVHDSSFVVHFSDDKIPQQASKIFIDKERSVWVGIPGVGLAQIILNPFEFIGLNPQTKVNSIENDKWNTLIVGTSNGVYKCVEFPQENRHEISPIPQFEGNTISSLCKLRSGEYMIASEGKIWLFNGIDKKELTFDSHLEGQNVLQIQEDQKGNLWFIVEGFGAVSYFSNHTFRKKYDIANGFITNEIVDVEFDLKGNVWFGSHVGGLVKETKDGEFLFLSKDGTFPYVDINCLYSYSDSILLIGTSGNGLLYVNNDSLKMFDKSKGLLDDYVLNINADKQGNIWLVHRLGVTKINHDLETIRSFGKKDGFPQHSAINQSFTIDGLGNFWLGRIGGAIRIHSPEDNFIEERLPTFFNSVKASGDVIYKTNSGKSLIQGSSDDLIILEHDQNNLQLEFISISLKNPGRMKYRYALEGLDTESDEKITAQNKSTYNNLPPGNYSFKVYTYFNDLLKSEKPLTLNFKVEKPWWENWWFYVSQAAVLVIMILITYFFSLRKYSLFTKVMVYITLFVIFDYLEIIFEDIFQDYTGTVPIFQVLSHLVLALMLFPIEGVVHEFFKKRNEANEPSATSS